MVTHEDTASVSPGCECALCLDCAVLQALSLKWRKKAVKKDKKKSTKKKGAAQRVKDERAFLSLSLSLPFCFVPVNLEMGCNHGYQELTTKTT